MKSKFLATSKRAVVLVVLIGLIMLYGGQPLVQAQTEFNHIPKLIPAVDEKDTASQGPAAVTPVTTPVVSSLEVTTTPAVTPEKTPVVAPASTPTKVEPKTETPKEEPKPIWQNNGQNSFTTTEPVRLGETYVYPGSNLELKFTQLPTPSGKVTILKVAASAVPISGVVGDVYDITSSMTDGTFKYELSLPYDKSGSNVQVVYSEDAKNFTPIDQGKVDVLTAEKQVKAADLNHFTYFAVVSGEDASDGSAQSFNVSELADLQTANNWGGYVSSDRWPMWNYDPDTYMQFNLGSVIPSENSVSSAILHFRYARGIMGIIPFLLDDYGAKIQVQNSEGAWVDVANVWNDEWLTFHTYDIDLTSFLQNDPDLSELSVRFKMHGGNLLFPLFGGMRSYHDWVGLDIQTIPDAPVITYPIDDSVMINSATTSTHYLAGTTEPGATVRLYVDGSPTTWTVTAEADGDFLFPNTVLAAVGIDYDFDYMIPMVATVTSSNADSESAPSRGISYTKDTYAPGDVNLLSPADDSFVNTDGLVMDWTDAVDSNQPNDSGIAGYIYESYRDEAMTHLAYRSTLLTESEIPAPGTPDGDYWWHVKAVDVAGNEGQWSQAWQVTVDNISPAAPILISPVDGAFQNSNQVAYTWDPNSDVAQLGGYELSLFLNDTSAMQFMIDDPALTQVTVPSTDGVWDWKVRSVDLAGNYSPWSALWRVTVDTVSPAAPILISPTDDTVQNSNQVAYTWDPNSDVAQLGGYELSLFLNDTSAMQFMIDDPALTQVTVPSTDGVWDWKVRSVDLAGNYSPWSALWRVTVDTVAPAVPSNLGFNTPPEGTPDDRPVDTLCGGITNQNRIAHAWTDESASGAVEYERQWQYPGSSVWQGAERWTATNTDYRAFGTDEGIEGLWHVRVRARDAANNWSNYSQACAVTLDRTDPSAPILISPSDGSIQNHNQVAYTWDPNADVTQLDGYELSLFLDGLPAMQLMINNPALTQVTVPSVDGVWDWKVRSIDLAGNYSPWSALWRVTVDTVKPNVPTLLAPVQGAWLANAAVTMSWNQASGFTLSKGLLLATETFDVEIDGTIVPDVAGTELTRNLSDGVHSWKVRAKDAAGNMSDWSETRSFTVDTTGPGTPLLISPSQNALLNFNDVNLDWSDVTDNLSLAGYELEISSTVLGMSPVVSWVDASASQYQTVSLPDGVYTWKVIAKDKVGHYGNPSETRTFTVDRTAPDAPADVRAEFVSAGTVAVNWEAVSDADYYVVYRDGSRIATVRGATSYTDSGLENKKYEYHVSAVDAAGNEGGQGGPASVDLSPTPTTTTTTTTPTATTTGTRTTTGLTPGGTVLGVTTGATGLLATDFDTGAAFAGEGEIAGIEDEADEIGDADEGQIAGVETSDLKADASDLVKTGVDQSWWQTWWFWLLVALAVILIIWLIARRRKKDNEIR